VIDPHSHTQLKEEIAARIKADRNILEQLREEIRVLRSDVRLIQPRTTTSISLVGTDGGNNQIQYDPFLIQIIRVVDSSNNQLCLEVVTPTTNISILSAKQFNLDGTPKTPLGEMMAFLGIRELDKLSYMMRSSDDRPLSQSWVQVYRELIEWATLFWMIRNTTFGSDTLIVFDGLLRSKVFVGDLFKKLRAGIDDAIRHHLIKHRRRVYVVGLAKHSQVLTRYRLAMALEDILTNDYPAYVDIPREIETNSYLWKEYARDDDENGGETNKFVGGKLFFAKFGSRPRDPIWPVDILISQQSDAQAIIGYLLADALNGFPVPFYPLCLQKAHENAALVGFDFDILQDQIFEGIREILGAEAHVLDAARLQETDPARARYD
jgi:hypothetical protein